MGDNSQSHGLYKAGRETKNKNNMNKNNMNKWFALILIGVIIGVLLWNTYISDASIVPIHLKSNGADHGYGCNCSDGPWEDDSSNPCKERREIKEFSGGSCVGTGTYEYRNKADGTVCGYKPWENDSDNPCKERREIKKCSGGSCVDSGTYEYRNKADGTVCGYKPWENDSDNPCKERSEIKKCSGGSCVGTGTYEYRNKADGTVCGYKPWENDSDNPCKERREIKKCSGGSCVDSGTYEYRNKADGTVCGYKPWENDSDNPCKERSEIKKCSGGSCVGSGTYKYRNKPDNSRPKGCDDGKPCTPDQCINGACVHDQAYPQDGVCSGPMAILNNNSCFRDCCKADDDCYTQNVCTSASWWIPWCSWRCKLCNIKVVMCFRACNLHSIPPIWYWYVSE